MVWVQTKVYQILFLKKSDDNHTIVLNHFWVFIREGLVPKLIWQNVVLLLFSGSPADATRDLGTDLVKKALMIKENLEVRLFEHKNEIIRYVTLQDAVERFRGKIGKKETLYKTMKMWEKSSVKKYS